MARYMPRFAKSRDANEAQILADLSKLGFGVYRLDTPCDVLVARRGLNHLVEIKVAGGRLTPGQKLFRREWKARGCIHTGENFESILKQVMDCERGHNG